VTDHRDRDEAVVETAEEARQGPKGKPVLWVLVGGLALAVIALLYFVSTGVDEPPPAIGVQDQPVGPSSDTVPQNTEPGQLDPPPDPQK